MHLSPEDVRRDIPLTSKYIYIDNCATTPVPKPVIDAMSGYFLEYCANIERGAYSIASLADEKWNLARAKAAKLLLNCGPDEFIFTRNFTEGACILAYALEHPFLNRRYGRFQAYEPVIRWGREDNIVFSNLEHHSNMMPWVRLAHRVGAKIKAVEFDPKTGMILPEDVEKVVDEHTKLLAIQHISNVTGVIHPIKEFIKIAKEKNPDCFVFIDSSQGPGHIRVDIKDIDCDALAFSGHKGALGPQGSGGLYIRRDLLERMDPMEIGGGTIADVTVYDYRLREDVLSKRWEAGTPNIAGLIGLGRAAEYVANDIGFEKIERREKELTKQLIEGLLDIRTVEVYGETNDMKIKAGVVSFNVEGWNCHDISLALDANYKPPILTRAGHHCAIPAMRHLGIYEAYGGTVRASFHYYNMPWEVEKALESIKELASYGLH